MGSINKLNSLINTIISLAISCTTKALRIIFSYCNIEELKDNNNILLIIIDFAISYICGYYGD